MEMNKYRRRRRRRRHRECMAKLKRIVIIDGHRQAHSPSSLFSLLPPLCTAQDMTLLPSKKKSTTHTRESM
jgi:hypothetical protein